jgi:GNAT superfamily N-acetyltransferase
LLAARGYRPLELSNVLARSLDDATTDEAPLHARRAELHEEDAWVEASARGWAAHDEIADMIRELGRLSFRNPKMVSFLVEREGRIIATGSLGVHVGIALFAGASTIPEERGRGAQRALLRARLDEARARGCDVAMMVAEPGSASQRNAEKSGFRIAYTRTKWRLVTSRRAAARS